MQHPANSFATARLSTEPKLFDNEAMLPAQFEKRIAPEQRLSLKQTDLFWRINLALQKSLDIEKQIEALFEEFQKIYSIASCDYILPSESLTFSFGEPVKHSCTFTLVTEGEYMGELRFTRLNRFAIEELQIIESTILATVYPLRNALKYHHALRSAFTDSLTGTGNRISLENSLQKEIDISLRYKQHLSLAMIDVDYFKSINDQFGHAAGDTVLKKIAHCIMSNCRNADHVFRYGGEEFVILFTKTHLTGALVITERLRNLIEQLECQHKGIDISVSISAGVSSLQHFHDLPDPSKALLDRSDKALYAAKNGGRNRVCSDSPELPPKLTAN